MELRMETPQVTPESVAPKRVQAPRSREELLLPLTLRERLCVAAMAAALRALEGEAEAQRTATGDVSDPVFVASVALLHAFKDVTGVGWAQAQKFW